MSRSITVALTDIISAMDLAHEAALNISFEEFSSNRIRRAATERALLTISEAVRHLTDDLTTRHPHVPWQDIRGIGNKLRHEYWLVDAKIIWEVVQHHLGTLEVAIQKEIDRAQSQK